MGRSFLHTLLLFTSITYLPLRSREVQVDEQGTRTPKCRMGAAHKKDASRSDAFGTIMEIYYVAAKNAAPWFVTDPMALVSQRIDVEWLTRTGGTRYFAGTVTKYDSVTGQHTVEFDDGDKRNYILAEQTIRVRRPGGTAVDTFTAESHRRYLNLKKTADRLTRLRAERQEAEELQMARLSAAEDAFNNLIINLTGAADPMEVQDVKVDADCVFEIDMLFRSRGNPGLDPNNDATKLRAVVANREGKISRESWRQFCIDWFGSGKNLVDYMDFITLADELGVDQTEQEERNQEIAKPSPRAGLARTESMELADELGVDQAAARLIIDDSVRVVEQEAAARAEAERRSRQEAEEQRQRFFAGEIVEAQFPGKPGFSRAEITAVNDNGTYRVRFPALSSNACLEKSFIRRPVSTSMQLADELGVERRSRQEAAARAEGERRFRQGAEERRPHENRYPSHKQVSSTNPPRALGAGPRRGRTVPPGPQFTRSGPAHEHDIRILASAFASFSPE